MENENLILIAQFCQHHEVEPAFITSLRQFGLVKVFEIENEQYFASDELALVEKMLRLHYELGINMEGLDAIANLLRQIEALQQELIIAKNRLETFAP